MNGVRVFRTSLTMPRLTRSRQCGAMIVLVFYIGLILLVAFSIPLVDSKHPKRNQNAALTSKSGEHISENIRTGVTDLGRRAKGKRGGRKGRKARVDPSDAIVRLSKVFGISKMPEILHHSRSPPQYMTELYYSVTDTIGLVKRKSPYDADIVRSFPDRDTEHGMHYHYNVSYLEQDENILQSEFHVFKIPAKPREHDAVKKHASPHVLELCVYQVLDPTSLHSANSLRLLDAKKISSYFLGWVKFTVTRAVAEWINGTAPNYGLLISATSASGLDVDASHIRFAQRFQHHDSKQPILVVFTDDGTHRKHNYIDPKDEDYKKLKEDVIKQEKFRLKGNNDFKKALLLLNEKDRAEYERKRKQKSSNKRLRWKKHLMREDTSSKAKHKRNKRSSTHKERHRLRKSKDERRRRALNFRRGRRKTCSRLQMYVDFEAIGWSGWIISPKGYNAYHCSGECPFPLGQGQKPTNHATVQSIVHALRVGGKDVSTPCCVPNKLYSISLLYFDDDENVILKQYDDMVAASCGCH